MVQIIHDLDFILHHLLPKTGTDRDMDRGIRGTCEGHQVDKRMGRQTVEQDNKQVWTNMDAKKQDKRQAHGSAVPPDQTMHLLRGQIFVTLVISILRLLFLFTGLVVD